MADIREYKCPACGGAMEFDSKTQKMKCPYCDTVADLSDFEETQSEKTASKEGAEQGETQEAAEEGAMMLYVCESCGGEILADKTTGATSCPYCGNPVVVPKQFEGMLKPDLIIPFKLDKKQAEQKLKEHLKGKILLPRLFRSENRIKEEKGIYVPFWLYSSDADAEIQCRATKVRTWRTSDYEYTETSHFLISRGGQIAFDNVPADGSRKMDDTLMESIEPYDFKDAVPFQQAYLAGYLADRYDVNVDERIDRARERIRVCTEQAFRKTVRGYNGSTSVKDSNVQIHNASYWYAMYPVWLLNTTWKGEQFIFAMNGQTGKMVGDLPIDRSSFWKSVGIRTLLIWGVLYGLKCLFMAS